jgi:hypothetical protein
MTMAERREFFGYTYEGPGAPLDMLSPEAQIAIAARAAAEAEAAEAVGVVEPGAGPVAQPDAEPVSKPE